MIEQTGPGMRTPEDHFRLLLASIGYTTSASGLKDTPDRYLRFLREATSGTFKEATDLLRCFDGDGYDEMVTVGPIPFYSLCEHHVVPFFGDAWVSYIPTGRIVGLSKLARLVDLFSRRLQVQERLTQQIAVSLNDSEVAPKGVGVRVAARHLCMEMRGVRKAGAKTLTTCLLGAHRDDPKARAEFLDSLQ